MQTHSRPTDENALDPAVTLIVERETRLLHRFRRASDRARTERLKSSPWLAEQIAAALSAKY